ncbi:MAG: hypothetical protein AAB701_01950 [Patescibacteria group bacterium]
MKKNTFEEQGFNSMEEGKIVSTTYAQEVLSDDGNAIITFEIQAKMAYEFLLGLKQELSAVKEVSVEEYLAIFLGAIEEVTKQSKEHTVGQNLFRNLMVENIRFYTEKLFKEREFVDAVVACTDHYKNAALSARQSTNSEEPHGQSSET